MGAKKVCEKF